jgi:NAD(P)-dependent dehydrogenase (short-subunit alcohol dehydrogenase family)
MPFTIDLSGLSVLVTGASRGIGRALAEALAGAGAAVGVHYARSRAAAEAVAAACGPRACVLQADLATLDGPARLWADAVDALGGIDVLVNNAGVAVEAPLDAPTDAWADAWARTMHVNLRAPELLCRLAVPHMQQRGGGRLINVASRAAFRGDAPAYLAYGASKGGLVALTRGLARAYGADGLCAFVLAPGFTRTDMAQAFIDRYGEAHAAADLALPRLTEPADLAPLVVLLASGHADHATGGTFDVNAGSYVH